MKFDRLVKSLLNESVIPLGDPKDYEEHEAPTQKDISMRYRKTGSVDTEINFVENEGGDDYYEIKLKYPEFDYETEESSYKPIGYAHIRIDKENDRVIIDQTYINDEFRNLKYGQFLYRQIASFAQKNGLSKIYTDTITPSAINTRKKLFNLKMTKFGEHGLNAVSDVPKTTKYF